MASPPSPPLKHRRLEDDDAFVPPSFQLPARPPTLGFPSAADVIVVAKPRSRNQSSKAMLLNASPTLELPKEEVEAFYASLRRHPRCASIREKLNAIDEAYLEGIFGEEDAREDDTRRRVDYNAACAILKSNSSKRLSMCVSCLTRGQHRHYRSWVLAYMQSGVVPKAMEDYPDMSSVLDLVQREQTAYLHKFMEEIISCEACKNEAGYDKRLVKVGGTSPSHRACWNHNYMEEHVERFAKRWWRYRIESRLQRRLFALEAVEDGDDACVFREHVWDLKKGAPLTAASLTDITAAKPVTKLTPRTRQLAARCVADTAALRESQGKRCVLPAISTLPTLPLAVQLLDKRELPLHPSKTCAGSQQQQGFGMMEGQNAELPPILPFKSVVGVSFSLRLCKSALIELTTGHLSSYRADFRLPVYCTWDASGQRVDISIEKPLPLDRESRRNINVAAMKRLIDSEMRLPSNSRCSEAGCGESRCYSEVSFDADFSFLSVSNCVYDMNGQYPVFRMVKMEYNCKGYNTIPDDESTLHYESFSKKDVVSMWVLFHCNPTAVLYVYRVNAYSNAVIGIEQFSSVSFTHQVLKAWSKDVEVQRTWKCLQDVLQNLVPLVIHRFQQLRGGNRDLIHSAFILTKEKEDSNVSLCSVKACYPKQQLTLPIEEAVGQFIEASSRAVCRREYLPPCVWPFQERIPYTYAATPKKCFVINRTTEVRHDSKYYAKNDVWHHELRYYTVGEDDIVRERPSAES